MGTFYDDIMAGLKDILEGNVVSKPILTNGAAPVAESGVEAPNSETTAAMAEVEHMIHQPEKSKTHESLEELVNEMDDEEDV